MDVELDGTTILTEDDLHDVLDRALDFGPYYGRNLSALHDRLNYDIEGPVRIVWRNHTVSKHAIGEERFARIVKVFRAVVDSDIEAGFDPPFAYVLA